MVHNNLISVSVMCSDLMDLGRDIRILERNGVDMLHIDVMDGHFVPNLTFGPDFIKAMHSVTHLPLDIHLMVTDPELILSRFELREDDWLSSHVELGLDFNSLVAKVRAAGAHFGLAVNPETPVEALEPYLGIIESVTLMLVHPGFAGAKMLDGIMEKTGQARKWLDAHGAGNVRISVDGSVSAERARYMAGLGASVFVGGTAGIYRKGMSPDDTIPAFRQAISQTDDFTQAMNN